MQRTLFDLSTIAMLLLILTGGEPVAELNDGALPTCKDLTNAPAAAMDGRGNGNGNGNIGSNNGNGNVGNNNGNANASSNNGNGNWNNNNGNCDISRAEGGDSGALD